MFSLGTGTPRMWGALFCVQSFIWDFALCVRLGDGVGQGHGSKEDIKKDRQTNSQIAQVQSRVTEIQAVSLVDAQGSVGWRRCDGFDGIGRGDLRGA